MSPKQIDPGHSYANTSNISFRFYQQENSPAPFGYSYYLSFPPTFDANPDKSWPSILFLHGAGESQRGPGESYATLRHGIPKMILCYDQWKTKTSSSLSTEMTSSPNHPTASWPSIDIPLAPRLRGRNPNQGRSRGDADLSRSPVDPEACRLVAEEFVTITPVLDMTDGYGWNAAVLGALLDEVGEGGRLDPDRVHVTGFSMGGFGTWALALHDPERFASLVPICGGGDSVLAKNLRHVPHRVYHGELDDIIPLSSSKKMVRALKAAGADEVHFVRYPDLAHDAWTRAYGDPDLWRWMLKQRRTCST